MWVAVSSPLLTGVSTYLTSRPLRPSSVPACPLLSRPGACLKGRRLEDGRSGARRAHLLIISQSSAQVCSGGRYRPHRQLQPHLGQIPEPVVLTKPEDPPPC